MKRLLKIASLLEEGLLTFGLLGLAIMAFIEVVRRYVFGHSFTWFEEFSRYFCVFLTFLGASLGVKYGTHFSMDYVVMKVRPRVGHAMRMTGFLIGAVLFATVAWLAWEHSLKMKRFGTTSAAMGLPMFWAYIPMAVFCATMSLRFGYRIYLHARGFVLNVPLEIKREEAEKNVPDAKRDIGGAEP